MFSESYEVLKSASKAEESYIKQSEEFLFPKIDSAIQTNSHPTKIKALIKSLPSSESREKYIDFIKENKLINADPSAIVGDWTGPDYQSLYTGTAKALNAHIDDVMTKVNTLLLNNKIDEVNAITKLDCVCELAIIYIADSLRSHNKKTMAIS